MEHHSKVGMYEEKNMEKVASKETKCETQEVGPSPFLTFTWRDWYEAEVQAHCSIYDFLEAIEAGKLTGALAAALNLQEVAKDMLEELYTRGIDHENASETSSKV